MKKLIWSLAWLFVVGCGPSKYTQASHEMDDCEEYYDFIDQNLVKVDSGWYEFLSVEAIYEKYDEGKMGYPFLWRCLKGGNKAFVIEHFGEPHRRIIIPEDNCNIFIYCFEERCLKKKKYYSMLSNKGVIFEFSQSDTLIGIKANISFRLGYRRRN